MKIKFSYDSRDHHAYRHFGQVLELDKPINFDDANIQEKIQPNGNIQCVVYTGTYIAQNKTKKEYDIDELFNRVPHTSQGTDPRDVFREIVKNGLLVKGTNIYEKPFSSYWRADTGVMDAFDNCRSAMLTVQSPIAIGTYWYREWLDLEPNAVMPVGKSPMNGHMYANQGWKFGLATETVVNGEPMFIIEWWGGHTLLMPREVFNQALKPAGMQTWVLSTEEGDIKRKKNLFEIIKDLCINIIIALRNKIKVYEVEPVVPEPVKQSVVPPPPAPVVEAPISADVPVTRPKLLDIFCGAIRDYEGSPGDLNYRNNNPGNCRYSSKGYDPKYGLVKKDKNNFAIFKDYQTGWLYLTNLVRSKINEHPQRTIREFFYEYAPISDGNSPELYAIYVAKRLGVGVDFTINKLII